MIGDGAMTGGVAFEAIHQAGGLGTPIVVVLNDNGMSIAPNVGALSRYFNRIRLNPRLWHARDGIEGGLTKLPGGIGAAFERLGPQLKESIKAFAAPGLLWEELDWVYVGVIDGHDVRALRVALRDALAAQRPVVVHIATVKGKGFAPAEDGGLEGMERWHAAKPRSIANGEMVKSPSRPADAPPPPPAYTTVFGEALLAECRRDPRVIGITAAMNSGTGLNILQAAMPERYFDVGIAEQQAVLFAAGLALEGARPVAAIYSTFLQRAYDQIVHDVCLQRLPVVFAMDRAGLVGDDGPTHHGVFDIAYLRCLPEHRADGAARRGDARAHAAHRARITTARRRCATRAARRSACRSRTRPLLDPDRHRRDPARGRRRRRRARPRRAARLRHRRRQGARDRALLELDGIAATVADARFAKPIDSGLVAQLAAEHELLVTIEEGVLGGGFGSAVWETLNEAGGAPMRILRVGVPDRYVTHGAPAMLHEEIGYTAERIAERVRAAMDRPGATIAECSAPMGAGRGSTCCSASAACSRRAAAPPPRCSPARCASAPAATRAAKPGQLVALDVELAVDESPRFVSRGGIKLANALARERPGRRRPPLPRRRRFDRRLHRLPARGRRRPRRRPRRRLRRAQLAPARRPACHRDRARQRAPPRARRAARTLREVIVADVSFISLRTVLPAVLACAAPRFDALALVKPQFEVGKGLVGRGGVVRDAALRRRALLDVAAAALALGASVRGFHASGLPGPKGNIETFIALAEGARGCVGDARGARAGGRPRMRQRRPVITHGRPAQTRAALLALAQLAARTRRRADARR